MDSLALIGHAEMHARRNCDPSAGGSSRQPIITAYRQRALPHRCTEGPDDRATCATTYRMLLGFSCGTCMAGSSARNVASIVSLPLAKRLCCAGRAWHRRRRASDPNIRWRRRQSQITPVLTLAVCNARRRWVNISRTTDPDDSQKEEQSAVYASAPDIVRRPST